MRRQGKNGERGSILMEYAMLVFLAAIPVYLVWNGCSIPVDWAGTGKKIEYKGYGKEMQKFFEMVQAGIALPIP